MDDVRLHQAIRAVRTSSPIAASGCLASPIHSRPLLFAWGLFPCWARLASFPLLLLLLLLRLLLGLLFPFPFSFPFLPPPLFLFPSRVCFADRLFFFLLPKKDIKKRPACPFLPPSPSLPRSLLTLQT
ncbi:hypothetical protein BDQ94DRAFT_149166 [Aspergillus welwitschiae]|uniref:Transmembrane protein n=1 Tax=Aspergillus welwitschiae TaxID=1341132 RepID=A0A3F3PTF2_9EURO|nr:hypothetical protein BDQ94DRAFT_149166 [Aspergillus welwitschiae]RDH30189.1 hypothetical protein BDQ94DRAFT_149166 [Aspergillus welwitschiae]